MITVIYVSSAIEIFSDEELKSLLIKARDNNFRLGITGLLLHKDGNFMQALEGPKDSVSQLYKKISADPRHHNIIKLLEYDITKRSFSAWEMAFGNLNKMDAEKIPGYSKFMEQSFDANLFQTTPSKAQKLLLMFRQQMLG